MLNRVNYGDRTGLVVNQTKLASSLGEALTYLALEESNAALFDTDRLHDTQSRLEKRLKKTDNELIMARTKLRHYKAMGNGAKAALAAFGGAAVADTIIDQLYATDPITATVEAAPPAFDPTIQETTTIETSIAESPLVPEPAPETVIPTVEDVPTTPDGELPFAIEEGAISFEDLADAIESSETLGTYEIASGDTLTEIMKNEIPELAELTPAAQENAVANILEQLDPEDLRTLGIKDVNLVYAGDTLDLDSLRTLVTQHQEILDKATERFGA